MKKLSALFIMAVILGTIELSFADPFEFVKLFDQKNTDLIVFYSCEQGETLESACSSIYKESYFKFKNDGNVVMRYGDTEENGTWTSKKDLVKIKDSHGITEYLFSDGIYLGTISEGSGDLIAYKLLK